MTESARALLWEGPGPLDAEAPGFPPSGRRDGEGEQV